MIYGGKMEDLRHRTGNVDVSHANSSLGDLCQSGFPGGLAGTRETTRSEIRELS